MTAPASQVVARGLRPHRQVLLACRPGRWNERRGAWVSIGLVVFAVAVVLGGAALAGRPGRGAALAGLPVLVLAWWLLVQGLLTQNRVIPALTVPGHVRVLRDVAFAAWAGALGMVWLVALAAGFDPVRSVLRIAVLLAAVALTLRWPWSWLLLWAVPAYGLAWVEQLAGVIDGLTPAGRAAALAGVLACGPLWLGRLFGQGGESHRRWLGRLESSRRALAGDTMSWAALGSGDGFWARVARAFSWPYGWSFDRAVAPGAGRPPMSRVILANGPAVHGGVHLWWAALIGGVAGLVLLGVRLWAPPDWRPSSIHVWGPALGVMSLALNPALAWLSAWRRTRREQALLMLLPGVPRGATLNRAIARHMVGHFALGWAGGAAVFALLAAQVPQTAAPLAVVAMSLWPLAVFLCTDLSRLPDRPQPRLLGLSLLGIGLPAAAVALLLFAQVPAGVLGVGIGLASLAGLAWRYRALGRAPQALPVCRLP